MNLVKHSGKWIIDGKALVTLRKNRLQTSPMTVDFAGLIGEVDKLAWGDHYESLSSYSSTASTAGGVEQFMRLQLLDFIGVRVEAIVTSDDHDLARKIHALRK